MKRTISKMLGIAALAIAGIAGSLIATPAYAVTTTISCSPYLPNTNSYPRDQAGHAQLCTRTVVNGGVTTNTTPTTARANTLFGAVSGAYAVNKVLPAGVKSRLETKNVKYFFFNNRADGEQYFAGVAPYSGGVGGVINPPRAFVGAGGHCGNTGYGYTILGTLYIAVAIYDNCTLTGTTQIVNPALEKTILHETGHAFDDTFSSFGDQATVASKSAAFDQLRFSDLNALTTPKPGVTPAVWSGMNLAARDKHVCTLFAPNNNKPSALELALGSTTVGGPQGQVCAVGSPNGTRYQFWKAIGNPPNMNNDFTPAQIVDNKLKYFVQNNQELFAELFVTEIYGSYGTPNFLKFTDDVLTNNAIATATPGYTRAFDCTRKVVTIFTTTLAKPTAYPPGCTTAGSF
jgi:hypothetical protein